MDSKRINLNGEIFTLESVLKSPNAFLQAADGVIPNQTLARRKKESEEEHIKRLFMRCYRRPEHQVPTDGQSDGLVDAVQPVEVKAEEPLKPIKVTVCQTPNVLAMNTKELAIDVLIRLTDILMNNLYVTDPVQMPNDLLEAIKDLSNSARAAKAAAETVTGS